ncbi:MAG TPA: AAA family ATPase, partial [Acidimicrobiales bacterium]|nr:AAA family ATPase [Acidimicrobiales bacterium]
MLSEAGLDGPASLHSAFGSYRLLLPQGAWIDWEAADDAVERAERSVAEGKPDVAVAAGREAAEISARGFLNDDCPWVDAQRERLRDLHVRALQVNAQAHTLAGQHGRAVISARDALALDELRESSFRLLMQALAAAGERGEALRVWERCRVTLADELGVDPARETEAIYLSILGAEPSGFREPATQAATLPSGVVTFFMTDIVDSSALWERHPAAMAIALERHDRLVAETVGNHGGTVLKAKLEGDATVSVFPRASEAALAAMALRDALAAQAWPESAALQLRMALHAGEAIERDGDYFGPALNRAARLRAMAGAGQILVSQVVVEVVRDHLPDGTVLTSLGERQLRGLDRGEHVFQLGTSATPGSDDHSAPVERPPLPTGLASRGPFVGREAELARLAVEWATASAGTARAVLIAGEPGVGKSRLAAEWARRVYGEGALVLYGRCDEEFGAPYQPFAEALRALLPVLGPARLRSIRGVEQLARLAPDLTDHLPGAATPGQADPDTERSLLFDGLARLFAAVGAETPVVVVIDDLHWAAKPTLLLLRHLLRATEATRLLIVATYRSTDLSRAHPLAGVLSDLHRDGSADRLGLAGLAAEDVSAYLRAAGHEDTRLAPALSTVTSGNPFFLIEVLRHLEETGGSWDPTTLPQGVREAVDRRLSRLSQLANEALLVGAVAGSRFSLELIEQVLERDLVDPIDEARRAGLVVEEAGNRFRFYHALVRQSLLAECVSVKRVRLHQRIAAALEADPSSGGDANVADLARHYFECAFAGGAAKAVDYSRRAGEQAMVRLAFEEAADLYAQALQASEIDGSGSTDSDRAELLLVRCEALLAAGDPGAAGVVEQLTQAARRSPRLSGWATCFAGQLAMLIHPERLEATVAEVAAAADSFARIGDTEGEAKAHTVAASCLARLGRVADCEAALDRALVAARLAGNPRRVNAVLGFAPLAALWGPSPVPQASGRCLDVVRVLRITTGSEAVEAAALRCQAVLEAVRGRFEAARRMLGSARRSLESLGHTHGLLETDLFLGMVELVAGQPAEAEQLLRRAYDGFSARGVSADAAQAAALLARTMLAQNRIDNAIALSAESERFAGVDLKAAMAWRAVRAEALALKGQIPEALELARSAVALVEPTDALLDRAEAHLSLSVVMRAAGDKSGAERESFCAIEAYEKKGATALATAAQHIARSRRTASVRPASAPISQRRVRANEAYRSWEHTADLFEAGDFDGWAAWIAADFVDVDHISHVTSDRDTFVNAARSYATEQVTSERLLLASLGERHALTRYIYRYEGSAIVDRANRTGPAEFEQLLVEQDDATGRHHRLERFKPDDLHLALARLIELHADDELPPERRPARYSAAQLFRNARGKWSDDIVAVDHRPVGSPAIQGADSVGNAWDAWRALSPDIRLRLDDVLGFNENATLLKLVVEGHTDEGGWLELPILLVNQIGDDGLLLRSDVYLPEQLDDSLRQFDQLVQPSGDKHVTNLATRYIARIWEAEFAADWDAVAAVTHESVVLDDRRSIVGLLVEGREAYLDYV